MVFLKLAIKYIILISILAPWFFGCWSKTKTPDTGSENNQAAKIEKDATSNNANVQGRAIISQPMCGNGVIELGEFCDDGNRVAGDGCSVICGFETKFNSYARGLSGGGGGGGLGRPSVCGNGILEIVNEYCDDGNTLSRIMTY